METQTSDELFFMKSSLIEVLEAGKEVDFPHCGRDNKPYIKRFHDLDNKFSNYPVEMGAMKSAIEEWKETIGKQLQELEKSDNTAEKEEKIKKLLNEDAIIFLNKHGKEHIETVRGKAFEILRCFEKETLSYYEIFLLLCSISVHDVGNVFGRASHEKKISRLLDSECNNIIDDSVERRVIAQIAGVHGGSISGNKDTISVLEQSNVINNHRVRKQLLAAVLRLADELADDKTRTDYPEIGTDIIGSASEVFHAYSSSLHTVKLEKNQITGAWHISLKYEFDEEIAKKQFGKVNQKVYLLDEIYERTIKMERERRYCMRFLVPYCMIDSIHVDINVDKADNVFESTLIKYVLKEDGYPDSPYESIKDVDDKIMTGVELAESL